MAGCGQLALCGGFLEKLMGLVAAGFDASEDGGERGPGRVGEDPFGVAGDGCSHVAGQNATGFFPGRPGCEFDERRGECAVSGRLKVLDGLAGGVGLVGVVLRFVPAPGDDSGPDEGCDQGGQRTAFRACGGVDDVACRAAKSVGGTVFRSDLGPLGPGERLRGGLEFGAQSIGCLLDRSFDQFAQGADVGLGVRVVGESL